MIRDETPGTPWTPPRTGEGESPSRRPRANGSLEVEPHPSGDLQAAGVDLHRVPLGRHEPGRGAAEAGLCPEPEARAQAVVEARAHVEAEGVVCERGLGHAR